jgi:uncharacterized protein DUF955
MRRTRVSPSIETQANLILTETGLLRVPVPVEKVARRLHLRVEPAILGEDVSGILVLGKGTGTIGYNEAQSPVRQRFTIAHEIGHYVLHQDDARLFIDKQYIYHRDGSSSTGDDRREVEANRFAAALLMPEELLLAEVANLELDLGDELGFVALAKRFEVSALAMSHRLANLGVIPCDDDPD